MAGNLTIAQDYDHIESIVSGDNGMHNLMFHAAPAASQTFKRGAVLSLTAGGLLTAGGTSTNAMPIFAVTGVNDYDANSDTGNISGGVVAGYVGTGGYEIKTTEFVTGTYAPNTLLTYASSGDIGKVKAATAKYSDGVVVGCVSSGVVADVYEQSMLHFWTLFIPAVKLTALTQ